MTTRVLLADDYELLLVACREIRNTVPNTRIVVFASRDEWVARAAFDVLNHP